MCCKANIYGIAADMLIRAAASCAAADCNRATQLPVIRTKSCSHETDQREALCAFRARGRRGDHLLTVLDGNQLKQ